MDEPTTAGDGEADGSEDGDGHGDGDGVRVWLVERTYSDDEQNVVILVYATPDGSRYFRKERALVSFDDDRETLAAVRADPANLGPVEDPELRERYATEVARTRERYGPDDAV